MSEFDEIYTDLIMQHSMSSENRGELDSPTVCSLGHNPNCGDEIKLEVLLDGEKIEDARFSGHGCAISQSSTSIMIDLLRGKTVEEAKKLIQIFLKMLRREKITKSEKKMLGESAIFENVSSMPARVKCASLSWHTMEKLLEERKK